MSATLLESVTAAVKSRARKSRTKPVEQEHVFNKHSFELWSYGLYVPELRQIMKDHKADFAGLKTNDRFRFAESAMKTGNLELSALAVHALEVCVDDLVAKQLPRIHKLTRLINNWGITDYMAGSVLQPLLLRHRQPLLHMLEKCNRSENMWQRRLSVVVFTRRVAESGQFLNDSLRLCHQLIWDTEDLVRKGVGWSLKDSMRADKTRIISYVKDLRRQGVSSTITLYAVRDLKGKERRDVLAVKKQ